MTGSSIPVVDISDFRDGGTAGKERVAKAVAEAFENVGFMIIVGHGFPQELVVKARKEALAFFDLPLEHKLQFVSQVNKLVRGYLPMGGEVASVAYLKDRPARPDLKEAFNVGPIDVTEEMLSLPHAATSFASNLWPEEPVDFRFTAETYYREMEQLADRMRKIFAYALDLPETFFPPYFDKHSCLLRMQNYPEQKIEPEPGQLRIGEHTDYGAFTLLNADNTRGGLQVFTRSKQWVDVYPTPDSFVVNVSDMMMTWTNDRWISNLHRVVNPPRGVQSATRRLSIAFFVNPNHDALIECMSSCQGPGNPPRHPAVLAGEHRFNKLQQTEISITGD
jgi:isopenicillin N synthase-like dioxygenase